MGDWKVVQPIQSDWKIIGPAAEQTKGWSGVGEDIFSGIGSIPGKFVENAGRVWENLPGALQQFHFDPVRFSQNMAGGLTQGLHNTANIPAEFVDYLKRKEILPEEVNLPRIPKNERSYPEIFGREGQRPGDALLEDIGQSIPNLIPFERPLAIAGKIAAAPAKVTRSGASKSLLNKLNRLEGKYNKEFGELFHKSDIKRIKSPKDIAYNEIISNVPKNYTKNLLKLERNPTLKSAQDAQSDLRKGIEWIKKKGGNASRAETDAMHASIEARDKIKDVIRKELNRKNPEYGKRYDLINQGYKEELAPLKYNPHILEYLELATRPGKYGNPGPAQAKMLKGLGKDVEFQGKVGKKYREIGLSNAIFNPYTGAGAAAVSLGLGANEILRRLLNGER